MAKVIIIIGSKAELEYARKMAKTLQWFGISSETRVASAQKSLRHLLQLLDEYEAEPGARVYITVGARNSALAGIVDAAVSNPVIACIPLADAASEAEVYATLRAPAGVAPAVVSEPDAASLLAAKILALAEPALQDKVRDLQTRQTSRLQGEDRELRGEKPAGE
jgi:phosphoribosylaminoimidazole carboxylase PurE protein